MKKCLKPLLAASLFMGLAIPAALANVTSITIEAQVEDFVVLQIETAAGDIVSGDDLDPTVGSPPTPEVLDFGFVDPLGQYVGTLVATNSPASGTLARRLLINDTFEDPDTYSGAPPANDEGAVYYVSGGYQLRGLRNDGQPDMDVDIEVTGATALDAFVDLTGANSFTPGSSIAANSLRQAGGGFSALTSGMALNTGVPIDLGVFVTVGQAQGNTSTVITFTGS